MMILVRTGASHRTVSPRYIVEVEFYTDSETSVTIEHAYITNKAALEAVEKIIDWCKASGIDYEVDVL